MSNAKSQILLVAITVGAALTTISVERIASRAARASEVAALALRVEPVNAPLHVEVQLAEVALPPTAVARVLAAPNTPLKPVSKVAPAPPRGDKKPAVVGELALEVIDAVTGKPLTAVRVRALSATRLADRTSGKTAPAPRLRLTPDVYELHVASPGYEPAEFCGLRVVHGKQPPLAAVALVPGQGRIEGRVDGPISAEDALQAELVGEGRGRCPKCVVLPCSQCGFGTERSRVAVGPGGYFEFDRLASANYVVRLYGAGEREFGAPRRIELRPSEVRSVAIPVVPPRTVSVSLHDVDGASLSSVWAERFRDAPEVEEDAELNPAIGSMRSMEWECALTAGDELAAQGSFQPPPPPGMTYFSGRRTCCIGGSRSSDRDDRARGPGEELRPPPHVPEIRPLFVQPFVDARGFVRIEHVPARVTEIELECDRYFARARIEDGEDIVLHATLAVTTDDDEDAPFPTYSAYEASEQVPRRFRGR